MLNDFALRTFHVKALELEERPTLNCFWKFESILQTTPNISCTITPNGGVMKDKYELSVSNNTNFTPMVSEFYIKHSLK